ncbi:hypothetical protein QM806_41390, partial [Rhodococcus sp. IEGM 1351]|nr:hypothetical protein [Rhodococcus sp. IEGM 1351]
PRHGPPAQGAEPPRTETTVAAVRAARPALADSPGHTAGRPAIALAPAPAVAARPTRLSQAAHPRPAGARPT